MIAVKGIVTNGQIALAEPVTWPDGTEVRIRPIPDDSTAHQEITGMTEEEQGDDPESIERWIAAFNAIPPIDMTPQEEAEWQAARKAQREFEKASINERAEKLRSLFE